jgi:hypothetical protein
MEIYFMRNLHKQQANYVRTNLLLQVDKEVSDKINSSFKINSRTLKDLRKEMEQHLYIEFEEKITSSSTPISRRERGSKKHFRTVCGLIGKNQTILEYQDEINEKNNLVDSVLKLKFRKELEEKILSINSKCDKETCYQSFLFLKNLAFSLKKPSDFIRNLNKNRVCKTSIKRDVQTIILSTDSNLPQQAEIDNNIEDFDCVLKTEEVVGLSNKYKSKNRNELPFIQLIPCNYLNKKKSSSFCISLHKCNAT